MAKQIKIRIHPDGKIEAETLGIKGKACLDFIPLLEEVLKAETIESSYTSEYYEDQDVILDTALEQQIKTSQ